MMLHSGLKLSLSCLFVAIALPATLGQAQTAATDLAPVFDVASIREHKAVPHEHTHLYSHPDSGEFGAINVSFRYLLQFAFDLPDTQILGGPEWLDSKTFDIEAKADASVDDRMKKLSFDEAMPLKRKMLQALLADRFQLKTHPETRELPVFALVVAKGGSKLHEAKDGSMFNTRPGQFSDQGASITVLAEQLARELGRVVVDRTGIAGRFDVTLQWTPDSSSAAQNGSSGPSIFTAVQEQLGLKLESTKAPVAVVVVDHVEMPSAN